MRVRLLVILPAAVMLLAAGTLPLEAAGRVQLELVGDAQGSALVFQEWLRVLSKAGVGNVRIRSATAADKVGIEVRGTEASPLYVVTGVLRSRDELLLPPGRFRQSDAARLARWLDELARLGPADRREPQGAFGLSSRQFDEMRRDMTRPVGFSTRGMTRAEAVAKIGGQLPGPLKIDPGLAQTLAGDKIGEELLSLSRGTSLACVLRPMGVCLVPRPLGDRVVYTVTRSRPGLKPWPVGWEPDGPARDVLPALFEFHNMNIQGVTAATALEAIGKRLNVPILLDHNALARHGIDPGKATVSHPRSRTTYSLVLRKILFQAGLKSEVRVDEADKPFLWVSTVKPV